MPTHLALQHTHPVWLPMPPIPLNTMPHTYLALPWDSAWQEWGPPHAPHLSHALCLPRNTARTKDCTQWWICCSWGDWHPLLSRSLCWCPCLAACHCAPLTLNEQQQLHNCSNLCLVWFVPAVPASGDGAGQ